MDRVTKETRKGREDDLHHHVLIEKDPLETEKVHRVLRVQAETRMVRNQILDEVEAQSLVKVPRMRCNN